MSNMQNRFKSYLLWTSIASFIAFVLRNYFDIEVIGFDTAIDMLLGILVMLGIINNPENKEKL